MIGITSYSCINVERYAYLFYELDDRKVNFCFGRFFEQENDAGERQYVYEIWQEKIKDVVQDIVLPGIDLTAGQQVYVRNGEVPCFVEYSVPPLCRSEKNIRMYLGFMQMNYYDEFLYMLRSRYITQHTNCYLGVTEDDLFDAQRARRDREFWDANLPNMKITPVNEFHRAERLFDEVNYDAGI